MFSVVQTTFNKLRTIFHCIKISRFHIKYQASGIRKLKKFGNPRIQLLEGAEIDPSMSLVLRSGRKPGGGCRVHALGCWEGRGERDGRYRTDQL